MDEATQVAADERPVPDALSVPEHPVGETGARVHLVFLGLGPLVLSLFYLWQVIELPAPTRHLVLSPQAWPLIIACAMVVSSLFITIGIATGRWRLAGGGESEELNFRDVVSTLVALGIFMVVFERIGFLLTSFALVASLSTMTSPIHWKRNVLAAVVFAVLAQVLFDQVLGVNLPPGVLAIPTW